VANQAAIDGGFRTVQTKHVPPALSEQALLDVGEGAARVLACRRAWIRWFSLVLENVRL
jgi:hypothetical protein